VKDAEEKIVAEEAARIQAVKDAEAKRIADEAARI
jgi:hypothetical protein